MTTASIAVIASGIGLWLASGHDAGDPRPAALHPGPIRTSTCMVAPTGLPPALQPAVAQQHAAGSPSAAIRTVPGISRYVAPLRDFGRSRDAAHAAFTDDAGPAGSIAGVRSVELSATELARIGVFVDSKGVWMAWRPAGEELSVVGLATDGAMFETDNPVIRNIDIPPFAPRLVTDDLGARRILVTQADSVEQQLRHQLDAAMRSGGGDSTVAAINRQIDEHAKAKDDALMASVHANRLVAILVHGPAGKGTPDSNAWRPDCILWFDPSPELLSRLPARIRGRLEVEIQSADALAQHRNSDDSAAAAPVRERVAGERPYLDELRNNAGAVVETTVLPNPTHEYAAISYRLLQPRVVEISLHDVAGRRLRQVTAPTQQQAGRIDVPIDVSGLSPGMYFVAIRTDGNERAVQRLIVAP
ncbi:MAG: T9SS type A sorting domain-containing protein [Bacteroidetes bacterium]|nr:T9SS type A sorting domain-containing protein [Bacteroidota bacterium]